MRVVAPVTDYIRASIMTTQGDLAVRGAAAPERLAAGLLDEYLKGQGAAVLPIYEKLHLKDTGVKIGNDTRAVAGDQVIAGVGFESSIIIFGASNFSAGGGAWSWGAGKVGENQCFWRDNAGAGIGISTTRSIYQWISAAQIIEGYITAIGPDGFTITWLKIGVAAEADFIYICLP